MNMLERIFLRLIRLRSESIKIGCIFLVFALLFLFVSVVSTSVTDTALSLPSQYQPHIKLQPKEGKENLWKMTVAMAERALNVDDITGYNGLIAVYAMLPGIELIPGKFSQTEDPRMNLTRFLGNSSSMQSEYFLSDGLSLLSGTNISGDMKDVALISSEIATMNNINVGDVITIETSTDSVYGNPDISPKSFHVTVTGVFDVSLSSEEDVSQKPECDIKGNFVFIDNFSAGEILSSIHGAPYDGYNSGIMFFSASPETLDQTTEQLLFELNISKDDVTIIVTDGGYSKAVAPLLRMTGMLNLILTIIALAGGAIIAIFYYASTRKRFREFAIYMSIGIPKRKIVLQIAIEALIYIIPAVFVSAGIVELIINGIDIKSVNMQFTLFNIAALAGYMIALLVIVILITTIILIQSKPRDLFSYTVL